MNAQIIQLIQKTQAKNGLGKGDVKIRNPVTKWKGVTKSGDKTAAKIAYGLANMNKGWGYDNRYGNSAVSRSCLYN